MSPIRYGMQIRLTHCSTDRRLMSLDRRYINPDSSKQQLVVATITHDSSTLWLVKGSFENRDSPANSREVRRGDIIRLEHVATEKNLHSHGDRRAPIDKSQQEVTAWLQSEIGDNNDNWVVEPRAGDVWFMDEPVRLVHQNTKKNLHSHDNSDPELTAGFQEVTGFGGRDDNDLWVCRKLDQIAPDEPTGSVAAGETTISKQQLKPFTEHFRQHPVVSLFLLCAAVAVGTWAVCKATLIEIAEQKAILAERRFDDEKTNSEQLKTRISALQTELTEKDVRLTKLSGGSQAGQPTPDAVAQLTRENASLRSELQKLQIQLSEEHAREWPPLTDAQILSWANALAPQKIKTITIFWGVEVDAKKLYLSIRKLGERLNVDVTASSGNGTRNKIYISASDKSEAGTTLTRLFGESKYPVQLDVDSAVPVGEIRIFIGEKP